MNLFKKLNKTYLNIRLNLNIGLILIILLIILQILFNLYKNNTTTNILEGIETNKPDKNNADETKTLTELEKELSQLKELMSVFAYEVNKNIASELWNISSMQIDLKTSELKKPFTLFPKIIKQIKTKIETVNNEINSKKNDPSFFSNKFNQSNDESNNQSNDESKNEGSFFIESV